MISSRRVDCLRKMTEIEIRLRRLNAEAFNLASVPFQALFGCWVSKMHEVANEILSAQQIDLFLSRFARVLEHWEEEGQQVMEAAMQNIDPPPVSWTS